MARDDLRCFVAVELPRNLRRRLNQEIGFLQLAGAQVRWVSMDNLHLTVRFIGDVRPDEVMDIQKACGDACENVPPCRMIVRGMSTLPAGKPKPRVIAAGVLGSIEPLHLLFNNLQKSLAQLGFNPERKGYRPHVTLGRVRGDRALPELLEKVGESDRNEFGQFNVTQVHLMMSDLTENGPVYTPMQSFPLNG